MQQAACRLPWFQIIAGLPNGRASRNISQKPCSLSFRSQKLYYAYSAFLVSELLAPPVSSLTMGASPWLSLAIGIMLLLACLAILLAVWHVEKKSSGEYVQVPGQSPLLNAEDGSREPFPSTSLDEDSELPANSAPTPTPAKDEFEAASIYATITSDSKIVILLLGFLLCPVRQILVFEILVPYASLRYHINISKVCVLRHQLVVHIVEISSNQAGFSIPLIAVSNLVCFLFIIPLIMKYLRSKGYSPPKTDLSVAQGSLALLGLSAVGIGVSTTLAPFIICKLNFHLYSYNFTLITRASLNHICSRFCCQVGSSLAPHCHRRRWSQCKNVWIGHHHRGVGRYV